MPDHPAAKLCRPGTVPAGPVPGALCGWIRCSRNQCPTAPAPISTGKDPPRPDQQQKRKSQSERPAPPALAFLLPAARTERHRRRPDEQGTAPRGRGECGFRSPKSFLGVNFFEGLPPSGPKNKGAGQKNRGFGHHGGGVTGMVHTILVELTKWWMLTICKRLMILLRATKSGGTILPGVKFTECLHLQAPKRPFGAKDETL